MTLPRRIVDCHHHFLAPDEPFHATLGALGAPAYTAEQYAADSAGLPIEKTVHIEALADDGAGEAAYVDALASRGACKVAAIVANCDLSAPDAAAALDKIQAASARVRGIRYILDYDGPFDGECPTHVACKAHATDYLRDASAAAAFERGFALLAARGLSFDLQLCPAQMEAAAAMISRHPGVPVVIDHMGKPWRLRADGGAADAAELAAWRKGMAALAALPQVSCKLSMLGVAVPGWPAGGAKEELLRGLVLETISLFGARRCMFNSNWHINGAVSNSDAGDVPSDEALTMASLFERFHGWVAHLGEAEREALFAGSAERFYRI